LLQQGRRGGRGRRKNQVRLQRDEFLRELLSRLRVAGWRPASIDPDVAVLRPPELLEFLLECGDEGMSVVPVALGIRHQHADAPHLVRLRARCERPSRRAAEQRDELAALHAGHGELKLRGRFLWLFDM
jgi:hypothetical protein